MAETVRPPEFSSEEEVAHILLHNRVFKIAKEPIYTWSGGLLSPIYSNVRLVNGDVDGSMRVTDQFVSKMQYQPKPDLLAGVVSAGPPWAKDVATRLRLPMVPVRPDPKDHGTGGQVDGKIEPGDIAIMFEDTVSTAGSIIKSADALRREGAIVDTAYAILDYQLFKSKARAASAGINIIALTNFPAVMKIAEKEGYWSRDEIDLAADWYKDPVAWAAKFETHSNPVDNS